MAVNCWVWVVPVARIMVGLAGVTAMDVSVAEEEVVLAAAAGLALCGAWSPPHCINAADIIKDRDKTNTIFSPLFINILLFCLLFHLKVRDI